MAISLHMLLVANNSDLDPEPNEVQVLEELAGGRSLAIASFGPGPASGGLRRPAGGVGVPRRRWRARQIMLPDRKPRPASAPQGFRLSAAQTVSSSGFTSFGFLVSGFGRSGCGLGRGRSITDFDSSPVRAFFI